jgi:hypothetical protein
MDDFISVVNTNVCSMNIFFYLQHLYNMLFHFWRENTFQDKIENKIVVYEDIRLFILSFYTKQKTLYLHTVITNYK